MAAENGHLAVLQWARSQGCPWNKQTNDAAEINGHRAVLEWIWDSWANDTDDCDSPWAEASDSDSDLYFDSDCDSDGDFYIDD
jgi:hypothetical protein